MKLPIYFYQAGSEVHQKRSPQIFQVSRTRVMISINRGQVPAYLRASERFKSLSCDESDLFSVPEANFKRTPEVVDVEQLSHLLHTLQFWGAQKHNYRDSLVSFVVSSPVQDRDQILGVLDAFAWSTELAAWCRAFHSLNDLDLTTFSDAGRTTCSQFVPTMAPFITAEGDILRQNTVEVLTKIASDDGPYRDCVFNATRDHWPALGQRISEQTPVADVRSVAKFLSVVLKPSYSRITTAQAPPLMPLLVRLLSWPDEETIAHACMAMHRLVSDRGDNLGCMLDAGVAPRVVKLLSSAKYKVLEAALNVGKTHFTKHVYLAVASILCSLIHYWPLRTVVDISSGPNDRAQVLLDLQTMPVLLTILSMRDTKACLLAMLVFTHFMSGTPAQRDEVLSYNPIPLFIDVVKSPCCEEFQERLFINVVCAACQDINVTKVRELVECGIMPVLCKVLMIDSFETVCDTMFNIRAILSTLATAPTAVGTEFESTFLAAKAQLIEHGGFDIIAGLLTHHIPALRNHAENIAALVQPSTAH